MDSKSTLKISDDMEEWEKWTNEELECQMSPSRWNPKKTPEDTISQFIDTCTKETEKAKQRIQYEANIAYGKGARQQYDLYGTDLSDKALIFFWVHGGYWQEGSRDMSAVMALNLHEIGVKTLVLGYTLAPEASIAQIKTEFYAALVHAMQRFSEAKFVIGGHSAGSQLAASLLHDQMEAALAKVDVKNRILGLLLFSGVFDLRLLVPTTINHPLNLSMNEARQLSPLHLPFNSSLAKDIKILVLVGGFDSPEFQRQSRVYSINLRKSYHNQRLWVSPEDDHFSIVEKLADVSPSSPGHEMREFIKMTLKH